VNVDHCQGLYEQTAALLANLGRFYKELESVGKAVLFTEENREWLRNGAPNAFGDLKFAVPNVLEKEIEAARELVMTNLRASPQALAGLSSPPLEGEQMSENEISEYVFRRYDPFVTQCISLYILLTNVINENGDENGYKSFYENSRQLTRFLREKFESSHQLNEQWRDVPKLLSATKRLIDELGQLRAKVSELSTTDFSAVMNTAVEDFPGSQQEESSDVFLTVKGIYKRVRTLINISGNQLCPPLLNWETSRFDYVGARINCLFKNQVFAIYEHLWNRGDPFSHWTSGARKDTDRNPLADTPKHPRPEGGHPRIEDEASRQRWLSIQTKIHKGEEGYNAWQISALLDPRAVLKGYYYSGKSLYNINALRDYLVLAFGKWHEDAAKEYHNKAEERSQWQEEYCRWFRSGYIRHVLRKDPVGLERELEQDVYFPEYLLRTPLDIFIHLLETNLMSKQDLLEILGPLGDFIQGYSNNDEPEVLWKAAQKIYAKASALANGEYSKRDIPDNNDGQLSYLELVELEKALFWQIPALKAESSRFGKNFEKWPDLRAFENETLSARLADMRRILEVGTEVSEIWRKGLRHILIELQSIQKQSLFDIGELRSSRNVLDRILCYVLLFRPEGSDDKFKDWSAHDLFYYVASLVPAEIQVRTALADTMAEQYHGVYKSNVDPAHSVAVQRRRLQEMGRKLDDLDRETEAIYDGYIVHSMLHAKS
jgi:ppGpp synthetase/RelA/SpoT-type nucleotidyltranferase